MSDIQALLFDKNYYNKRDIKAFLKRHNLVPCKEIHETQKYYRRLSLRSIAKQPRINIRAGAWQLPHYGGRIVRKPPIRFI